MQEQREAPYKVLNSGHKMPMIGLGTFDSTEGEVETVVKAAILEHGYRHIDTASVYGNEEPIGKALQECFAQGIKREDLFVNTKVWKDEYDDVEGALRKSLKKLQLEYVDLYLVHWMCPDIDWETNTVKRTPMHKVWEQMEKIHKLGLAKSIGVSNCSVVQLLDIFAYCEVKPAVNQVECNPYLVQADFVKFHERFGVAITAYAPLSAGAWPLRGEQYKGINVMSEPIIVTLAQKYDKTPAQIVLNWHLHLDHIIIPKTTKVERLAQNFNVFDFKMTDEEYTQISGLDQNIRLFNPVFMKDYGWNNLPYF